ncbi:MAG: hypothetical protein DRP97_00465 [Candidatus Latescibacterota bacterium]|nr:MAG: hypothetical protein DRP97_00465 [Candidatus Latescibacterota bacterium]
MTNITLKEFLIEDVKQRNHYGKKVKSRKWWSKARIGKAHDRRIKLTPKMKEEIVKQYARGDVSTRELAREWDVSRKTIQYTLDPEKAKRNYARRVETGGSKQYYDKDKQREYMRKHRKHLREVGV